VKSLLISGREVCEVIVSSTFDLERHPWVADFEAVEIVSPKEFSKVSDVKNSQDIIAVAKTKLTDITEFESSTKILALDGISDPGNAGSIIRTASWYGVRYVVSTRTSVDCFSPKVVRASMGGIWDVKVAVVDDLVDVLSKFKAAGESTYAADLEGIPLAEWQPSTTGVLVVGSEAHGISPAVRSVVDERVSIIRSGSSGAVESLNAAISCGIILDRWNRA
jgi:TrmH family RNA methyltransferase